MIFRICGIDIKVEFTDPLDWAENGMGRFSQISNRITIRTGMDKDVETSTLLHEIFHMIIDVNDLESSNGKVQENFISVLANSMNAFLKDNKKFLEYYKD